MVSMNQVVIYHDETKNIPGSNFKGHVLFFVPVSITRESKTPMFGHETIEYSPQAVLFRVIEKIRQECTFAGKFHFSDIGGKIWTKSELAHVRVSQMVVEGLRQKGSRFFRQPLCCKLAVIIYPKLSDYSIYGGGVRKEQKFRHDETILRMLLKGASHYLYEDNNRVEVLKVFSDGQAEHRPLNEDRIIWRLTNNDVGIKTPLREYVHFSPGASIIHLSSDHKLYPIDSDEYRHANFLQVADILLGSVIRSCFIGITRPKTWPRLGEECTTKKDVIASPVTGMLEKTKRKAGFINSGHYKSFAVSFVNFEEGGIIFKDVGISELAISDDLQMSFPV